jgi:uncharacterized protein
MKITKKIIAELEIEAKKFFKEASGCHDWSHVERVKKMALHIGKIEKADLAILEVAVLLHDIGRKEEMKAKGLFCHAEAGAKTARKILEKYCFEKNQIENIVHCIETHRYRNSFVPETIEAKILFDADKIDSLGAIGIGRIFLFAGSMGSGCLYTGNEKKLAKKARDFSYTKEDSAVLEYEFKLKNIKNKMLTQTGKDISKQRSDFMEQYFEQFWKEVKGLK